MADAPDGTLDVACADPGRLRELLRTGVALQLLPASAARSRRTAHTALLVRHRRLWVPLMPVLANRVFAAALERGRLPGLGAARIEARERAVGRSRFDFVLRHRGRDVLTEVKAVSLVVGRTALFPDAPTARGTRHVRELAALAREGRPTAIVFVVLRPDADEVAPHGGIDPHFASALRDARRAGVRLLAYTCRVSLSGCRLERRVPVRL